MAPPIVADTVVPIEGYDVPGEGSEKSKVYYFAPNALGSIACANGSWSHTFTLSLSKARAQKAVRWRAPEHLKYAFLSLAYYRANALVESPSHAES